MKKVLRTVQPPHKSRNLTVAQARKAWLEAEAEVRETRRRKRAEARVARALAQAVENP